MRFTYLIILILIYGCNSSQTVNNYSEMELSIYRFDRDISMNEFQTLNNKKDYLEFVEVVDSSGMVISRKNIPKFESENFSEEIFKYESGRIISYTKFLKDSIPLEQKQYSYLDKKIIISNYHFKKYLETDGYSGKSIKTFNDKGQLVNELYYDCYNLEMSSDNYTYSEDSILIETIYKKSNLISRHCLQIINQEGGIIEEHINSDLIDNNDKNLPQKWIYEYNQNGDLISSSYFFKNDLIEIKKLSYDYSGKRWFRKVEKLNNNIFTTIKTEKQLPTTRYIANRAFGGL